MNREFAWLDGCTVKACILSPFSFTTLAETCIENRLSQNTFSTSCFSLSRAESAVEAAEKSLPISFQYFSFLALLVFLMQTKGKRPNSPSIALRPKFSSSVAAWLPQDSYLALSVSKYCSDTQKTFFTAESVGMILKDYS